MITIISITKNMIINYDVLMDSIILFVFYLFFICFLFVFYLFFICFLFVFYLFFIWFLFFAPLFLKVDLSSCLLYCLGKMRGHILL